MTVHDHKKTDAQVQQDVLNELKWDTRVEPTEVGVEVRGGVVTLTGTVSSTAHDRQALRIGIERDRHIVERQRRAVGIA